ncbi:ADP-ribosylation factor-like protein 6-interacting protein 4 [Papio anubis]|uniref:ADP-ribosylation factor-like protein 6-interacting protein 4 n=1 Tax=Papio anubis TaxID=9555 RepID=UPI0012ADE66C|nr:ADP-ribosylation factor-like protein 6-interacting protein 4 [Papio anubis]
MTFKKKKKKGVCGSSGKLGQDVGAPGARRSSGSGSGRAAGTGAALTGTPDPPPETPRPGVRLLKRRGFPGSPRLGLSGPLATGLAPCARRRVSCPPRRPPVCAPAGTWAGRAAFKAGAASGAQRLEIGRGGARRARAASGISAASTSATAAAGAARGPTPCAPPLRSGIRAPRPQPSMSQQTPEIYSVELSGTKDIVKTDKGDGKEKYRGLKNNCLERKKKNHKEEFQKELHLVSSLKPQGSCRLWPFPARAWP